MANQFPIYQCQKGKKLPGRWGLEKQQNFQSENLSLFFFHEVTKATPFLLYIQTASYKIAGRGEKYQRLNITYKEYLNGVKIHGTFHLTSI